MAESYLETLRLMKSAKWTREARRLYEVHLEAAVGARLAADIDVRDVRRLHERLASTPVQANRVKAVLSGILSRAEVDGARPKGSGNPCSGVDDYVETKRERILSDDEWKRFAKALKAESLALRDVPEWDTRPAQLRAVMLIALTGARKEAVTRRVWSDLDEAAGILKVEPAHKGATRIYLGPPALKLLTAWQRERSKSPYIFPGQQRRVGPRLNRRTSKQRPLRSATPIASLAPVWNSLRERAELEDFTLHDLRHQLGTVGGDVGLSAHLIGGLLSHRVPGITGTYAHRSDPTLREAAARVSAEIAKRLQLDTAVRAGRWLALAK
jgi:integrase